MENELYLPAFSLAWVTVTKSNCHLAGFSVSDFCCCCSHGLYSSQCVMTWIMLYIVFGGAVDILWKRGSVLQGP